MNPYRVPIRTSAETQPAAAAVSTAASFTYRCTLEKQLLFARFSATARILFCLVFLTSAACGQSSSPSASPQLSADSHLGRAYEELKQDRYDEAVADFRAALAIDPSLNERARFPMAVALFEAHKLDDARKELELVRKQTSDHPNVLYYLGRIELDQRQFPQAIHDLEAAATAPPFPDTSYYLGYAYLKSGNLPEAMKWLQKAAQTNPNDARIQYQLGQLFREQGDEADATKALAQSSEIRQREDEQSQLKTECGKALERGPSEAAHQLCDQLYDPNDAEKLTALGSLYGQHGDYQAAVKPFARAAELMPQSPQMQYNVALAYFYLRDFNQAAQHLKGAVEGWPDLYQLNALYGAVLSALGEDLQAHRVLKRAHELDPQNPGTTELLYACAMKLGTSSASQNRNAEALEYLREAAALEPNAPDPYAGMAKVHTAMGQAKEAQTDLARAEQLRKTTTPR